MGGSGAAIEWARELSPVAVVDEADDVLNLDSEGMTLDPDEQVDVDALAERLRAAVAATGSILSTQAGARAVLQSGVPTIVRLPGQHAAVLLLRLAQEATSNDNEEERAR